MTESATIRPFILPTSELVITMTLGEYEAHVQFIKEKGYVFTTKEEKEIKASIRRINNRIQAAESRLRKKTRLEFLEGRVDELELENTKLRSKIKKLEDQHPLLQSRPRFENLVIKEEPLSSLMFEPYSYSSSMEPMSLDDTLSF